MNFSPIHSLVLLFIFGQIAGIVGGVYLNIQSWKWRIDDDSFAYSLLAFMFVVFIMISVMLVVLVAGSDVKGFLKILCGVLLTYASLLWPAWNQVKQYKISLRDAYFGTVFQFHVTVVVGFCCLLVNLALYNFLRPGDGIGIELLAFLLHIMVVFYLMAFARPFWMKELYKLKKLVRRH